MNTELHNRIKNMTTLNFLHLLLRIKNHATRIRLFKMRCLMDVELFSMYFFRHYCRLPFNEMHRDAFEQYQHTISDNQITFSRKGSNIAIAAPRGSAKSTLFSLILPIHSIMYQQEKYITILSSTLKQATQRLRSMKIELTENERLERFFPVETQSRQNNRRRSGTWNVKSINVNGVQVDVFSTGAEIRGITYSQFRPTRIIIDDGENSAHVTNPEQREKLRNWFSDVVENLGDSYTNLYVVGTILHPDSLLSNLLKRPDFKSHVYRSVMKFSPETKLWNTWKDIYTNLDDENRAENAEAFFRDNQDAMLRGTDVLWNEKESYYDLMCQLATRGRRTFFKEKQNDPRGSESLVFDPNALRYFTVNDGALSVLAKKGSNEPERRVPLNELTIVGFLDSTPQTSGRSRKTDYAAIATVGIDSGGCKYLLDVWIQRAAPTAQVTRIFDQHQIWNYTLFGIEGNCFQNLLMFPIEEERKRRKEQRMNWRLPIEEVTHVKNKETRLMSLEPIVSNGWLLFNRDLPEMFFQQIEEFPTSLHDDALDALESAVALSPNVTYTCDSVERRHSVRALQHF